MKKVRLVGLALAGALAAAPMAGFAQYQNRASTESVPNFYGGIGGGYYWADGGGVDDDSAAWRAYAGANFLPWLGVEGMYANFGEIDGGSLDVDGWGLAAVAQWPIAGFLPYVKLGNFWWDADAGGDGDDLFGGAGVRFNLAEHVDLRVEYNRFEFDDVDADTAWVDVQYRF